MEHFAGLDLSVKEASICIDDSGKIVRKVKLASEPDVLLQVLKNLASGGFGVSIPSSALSGLSSCNAGAPAEATTTDGA